MSPSQKHQKSCEFSILSMSDLMSESLSYDAMLLALHSLSLHSGE